MYNIFIAAFVHKFSLTSLTLTSFKTQQSPCKMKYSITGENGRKPSSMCKNTRKILAYTKSKNKEKSQFSFIHGKCKNF